MEPGRRYVRVLEGSDGAWVCRQGRFEVGSHATREAAIEQAVAVASDCRPAEILLHRSDGTVESLMALD